MLRVTAWAAAARTAGLPIRGRRVGESVSERRREAAAQAKPPGTKCALPERAGARQVRMYAKGYSPFRKDKSVTV